MCLILLHLVNIWRSGAASKSMFELKQLNSVSLVNISLYKATSQSMFD